MLRDPQYDALLFDSVVSGRNVSLYEPESLNGRRLQSLDGVDMGIVTKVEDWGVELDNGPNSINVIGLITGCYEVMEVEE